LNSLFRFFFAAIFEAYFIQIHFANPDFHLHFTRWNNFPQQNAKQLFIPAPRAPGEPKALEELLLNFCWGWPPLCGGDSKNNTPSCPTLQLGRTGGCR
jgi:hypothetical protein